MTVNETTPFPNACLVTAFSYVLDISVFRLIEKIGHNGQKVVKFGPGMSAPMGFCVQEIIDVVYHDFSITEIARAAIGSEENELKIGGYTIAQRINIAMQHFSGVVAAKNEDSNFHAYAWDHEKQRLIDPNFARETNRQIKPEYFWIVSKR